MTDGLIDRQMDRHAFVKHYGDRPNRALSLLRSFLLPLDGAINLDTVMQQPVRGGTFQ